MKVIPTPATTLSSVLLWLNFQLHVFVIDCLGTEFIDSRNIRHSLSASFKYHPKYIGQLFHQLAIGDRKSF